MKNFHSSRDIVPSHTIIILTKQNNCMILGASIYFQFLGKCSTSRHRYDGSFLDAFAYRFKSFPQFLCPPFASQ